MTILCLPAEFLTNGDLKQEDVAGGFSPGDSPISASPPALTLDTTSEEGPPPVFSPDPTMGEGAAAPVVEEPEAAEGEPEAADAEDVPIPPEEPTPPEVPIPPVAEVPVQVPMANGICK